ncbi:hypothetical protein NP233_g7624 [Leucocoprinus birnbaumii]|uniref:Uncharacterized protein n=1 Tax=Leucocoprinus birnbaumii TaxID=56174 RepID=A0AAD5VNV5_9AGAR|nr:hypothetical protein NP233_g7624 [Leucocoprinus birnbaumii]
MFDSSEIYDYMRRAHGGYYTYPELDGRTIRDIFQIAGGAEAVEEQIAELRHLERQRGNRATPHAAVQSTSLAKLLGLLDRRWQKGLPPQREDNVVTFVLPAELESDECCCVIILGRLEMAYHVQYKDAIINLTSPVSIKINSEDSVKRKGRSHGSFKVRGPSSEELQEELTDPALIAKWFGVTVTLISMGRNGRSSPAAPALPKVVFEKIEEDDSTQPGGVHDLQARSYGYNDFSDFMRPEHYIRHIEPLESDLARQVEYDMDEQDQEWLDAINAERRKEQLDKVSCELFEIVMDRLEKEWFDLTKNIPKPDLALPSEDSTCAICDDSEGENSNAIVFCDGCNLAVHQDCYGVPYIPEGQWLCRKCTVSPENPVQCILCPNEGGAFKQTTHGDWVHLLCAIWVPETRVVNEVFMEPVDDVDKISKQRWKLKCSICDVRGGACIQCAKTSCFLAFHATCARKEKLLSSMKSTQGSEPAVLTCYCERHLPKERQEAREAALAAEESNEDDVDEMNVASKSARAYAKTYRTGPPLVPALIVNRIVSYIAKVTLRKKPEFVNTLCRYWSLKREARRGAPLLKRLHLEPWTATAGSKPRSDQEKMMKLEQLRRLRDDLLSLRALTELCRKREARKYRQAEIIYDVVAKVFFGHEDAMRRVLERIYSMDKQEFFKNPVVKQAVPDYYDIVKKPMCWMMIEAKLDRHEYWDVQAFKDDVDLVINNALLYNKSDSAVYRAATRLKKNIPSTYSVLDKERTSRPTVLSNGIAHSNHINGDHTATATEPNGVDAHAEDGAMEVDETPIPDLTVGDLEPPLDVLELLTSISAIKPDLSIDLQDEPLQSLFNYELATLKPPPTPPPPPPPKAKKKRDRKAEYERAKAKKAAAAAAKMATAAEALTLLNTGPRHNHLTNGQPIRQEEEILQPRITNGEAPVQLPPPPVSHPPLPTLPIPSHFSPPPSPPPQSSQPQPETPASQQLLPIFQPLSQPPPPPPPPPPSSRDFNKVLDSSPGFRMPKPKPTVDTNFSVTTEASSSSETPISTSPTSPKPGRAPRRKRPSLSLARTEIPPVVSDVDNRDSFIMFDGGWILPPDQRRGGRMPVDRSVQPPPRKRARTEQAPSRLSVVSTPASENQTLMSPQDTTFTGPPLSSASNKSSIVIPDVSQPPPRFSPEIKAPPETPTIPEAGPSSIADKIPSSLPPPTPVSPTISIFPQSISAPLSSSSSSAKFGSFVDLALLTSTSKIVEGANGTIIIEELDTPAIRRAKNLKRKEERRQEVLRRNSVSAAKAEGFAGSAPNPTASQPQPDGVVAELVAEPSDGPSAGPSTNPPAKAPGAESELSSLSEFGEEPPEESGKPKQGGRKKGKGRRKSVGGVLALANTKKLDTSSMASVAVSEGGKVEGGTLVWAKADSYPWWPAVIFEQDDPDVPRNILQGCLDARDKRKVKLYILRFFDKNQSWQYLPHDRLLLLGEDQDVDTELTTRQRWKSANVRRDCCDAYKLAMSEMETNSDADPGSNPVTTA